MALAAPPGAAGPVADATGFAWGTHPPPGANVGVACYSNQDTIGSEYNGLTPYLIEPLVLDRTYLYETECNRLNFLDGSWWVYASTCADPDDPQTCSKFTGTLRATIQDGSTEDEVFEFDFVEGVKAHTDLWLWWPQGDNVISHGNPDVTIEVLPLQGHDPLTEEATGPIAHGPGGGGHVYFYLTN